jgi:hypothetical protein
MICALEFVPSGGLRREPLRYEMSPEEMEEVRAQAELGADVEGAAAEDDEAEDAEEDDDEEDVGKLQAVGGVDKDGLPASLRMDEYDEVRSCLERRGGCTFLMLLFLNRNIPGG